MNPDNLTLDQKRRILCSLSAHAQEDATISDWFEVYWEGLTGYNGLPKSDVETEWADAIDGLSDDEIQEMIEFHLNS